MARKDNLTGKAPQYGNSRSKALNATRRRWNVNLQPATVEIDGKVEKVMISSKSLRTIKNKGTLKIHGVKKTVKLIK